MLTETIDLQKEILSFVNHFMHGDYKKLFFGFNNRFILKYYLREI